jgi:hypothetical protein
MATEEVAKVRLGKEDAEMVRKGLFILGQRVREIVGRGAW